MAKKTTQNEDIGWNIYSLGDPKDTQKCGNTMDKANCFEYKVSGSWNSDILCMENTLRIKELDKFKELQEFKELQKKQTICSLYTHLILGDMKNTLRTNEVDKFKKT